MSHTKLSGFKLMTISQYNRKFVCQCVTAIQNIETVETHIHDTANNKHLISHCFNYQKLTQSAKLVFKTLLN